MHSQDPSLRTLDPPTPHDKRSQYLIDRPPRVSCTPPGSCGEPDPPSRTGDVTPALRVSARRSGRWNARAPTASVRRLLSDPDDLAYYPCHGPAHSRCASWSGPPEPLGDRGDLPSARGEVGLDQYQARRYDSRYRHVTVAMLAHACLTVTTSPRQERTFSPRRSAVVTGRGRLSVRHLLYPVDRCVGQGEAGGPVLADPPRGRPPPSRRPA